MTIRRSIKESHESYPYNRHMAQALYRSIWLENWGSGAKLILQACQEQGVEKPTWRWDGGFVCVTFKRPIKEGSRSREASLGSIVAPNVAPDTENVAQNKEESIQERMSGTGKGIQKTPVSNEKSIQEQGQTPKSIQESIQELKTNRKKVLYILSQNPSINLEDVAKLIGLSRIGLQKIAGKPKAEGRRNALT